MAHLIDLSIYLSISFAKCESLICEAVWEAVGVQIRPLNICPMASHDLPIWPRMASHSLSIWPLTWPLTRPPNLASHTASHSASGSTASHTASHIALPIQTPNLGLPWPPTWPPTQPLTRPQGAQPPNLASHGLPHGLARPPELGGRVGGCGRSNWEAE